jgi:nicotinamide-nucleotide amidase
MNRIWEEEVVPRLRQRVRGEIILTRNIKTYGVSEGGIDEMVSEYLGKENPYLGIYSKADGIHLRIIARAEDEESARGLIEPVEWGLVSIVGPHIWGYDDDTPEQSVGHLLGEKNLTLATMESCTGGMLVHNITNVPESAKYYRGGAVISGAESAIAGGVPASIIEGYGLVSQEAAGAMAQAARERMSADVGIGVTGVPGPEEIEGKRVGTVHVAIALDDTISHFPGRLPARRVTVRRRATSTALIELRKILNTL